MRFSDLRPHTVAGGEDQAHMGDWHVAGPGDALHGEERCVFDGVEFFGNSLVSFVDI